jgi:hypothetical protein
MNPYAALRLAIVISAELAAIIASTTVAFYRP